MIASAVWRLFFSDIARVLRCAQALRLGAGSCALCLRLRPTNR